MRRYVIPLLLIWLGCVVAFAEEPWQQSLRETQTTMREVHDGLKEIKPRVEATQRQLEALPKLNAKDILDGIKRFMDGTHPLNDGPSIQLAPLRLT